MVRAIPALVAAVGSSAADGKFPVAVVAVVALVAMAIVVVFLVAIYLIRMLTVQARMRAAPPRRETDASDAWAKYRMEPGWDDDDLVDADRDA